MNTKKREPPTYIVLKEVAKETWEVVGEVERRPGLPARRGRARAVADAICREPRDGERYAVIPRSEWRNGCDW
jgi:hypothetical protein